jgi:superfamily II DNA or RNA helicase
MVIEQTSSRTLKQIELVNNGIRLGLKIFYELCTGFGKTRIAILIIKLCNEKHPTKIINIVVPTTNLKNDWIDKKKGHIVLNGLKNVNVYVVNTYVKTQHDCGLLICDELHHYCNEDSATFKQVIVKTKFHWFVGLSATLEANHKAYLSKLSIVSAGIITAKEAMDNKWISQYKILCVPIELDVIDQERYDEINKNYHKYGSPFNNGHSIDFKIAMSCLKKGPILTNYANEIKWEEKKLQIMALQWNLAMQKRKNFLNHIESKIEASIQIVKDLKMKSILFGQSIEGADKIANALGNECVEYHSKMTKKQANVNLKKLKDGRTKVIYISSAKGLEEGFDLPGLQLGLTWSRNSKSLRANQCLGRISRFDYSNPDKIAYMIELYVTGKTGTQDLTWLKKSLKKQCNIFWLQNINQVKQIIEQDKQNATIN